MILQVGTENSSRGSHRVCRHFVSSRAYTHTDSLTHSCSLTHLLADPLPYVLACWLTCLLACLLTCLPAYSSTSFLSSFLTYLFTYLCMHVFFAYLPVYVFTYTHPCMPRSVCVVTTTTQTPLPEQQHLSATTCVLSLWFSSQCDRCV